MLCLINAELTEQRICQMQERATAKAEAEATLADAKTALERLIPKRELERELGEAGTLAWTTIHPVGKDLVLDELEEEVDKQIGSN